MAQEGEQDGRLPPTTTQAFLFPYPVIFSSSQDQGGRDQFHGQQTVVDQVHHDHPLGLFLESGSSDAVFSAAEGKIIVGQSSHSQHCREDVRGSVGSMRSEMNASERSSPDQQLRLMDMDGCNSSSSRGGGAVIKMCSSCSATKTPLWRSGPKGPKSLCNACGIRQRKKARRATEAAAAAAGSGLVAARKVRKEKKIDGNCILPYKKRYKIINAAPTG